MSVKLGDIVMRDGGAIGVIVQRTIDSKGSDYNVLWLYGDITKGYVSSTSYIQAAGGAPDKLGNLIDVFAEVFDGA